MNTYSARKRLSNVCARCGCTEHSISHRADVVDFKGLTLDVEGLAETVCAKCHYRWTTSGQEKNNLSILQEAFAQKRDAVRVTEGLLSGDQIAFVLEQLKLSKSEASLLFGGGPNAFGKYIRGDVLQSYAMDQLLRLTPAFGQRAVSFLRDEKHVGLRLNSAGYFLAPSVNAATFSATAPAQSHGEVKIVSTNGRGAGSTLIESVAEVA